MRAHVDEKGAANSMPTRKGWNVLCESVDLTAWRVMCDVRKWRVGFHHHFSRSDYRLCECSMVLSRPR